MNTTIMLHGICDITISKEYTLKVKDQEPVKVIDISISDSKGDTLEISAFQHESINVVYEEKTINEKQLALRLQFAFGFTSQSSKALATAMMNNNTTKTGMVAKANAAFDK